jgi:hypothetical protein
MAIRNLSTHELHVLHVFQDDDFANDMNKLLRSNGNILQEGFFFQNIELLDGLLQPLLNKWCISLASVRDYIDWLNQSKNEEVADYLRKQPSILLNPNIYIQDDGINQQDRFSSIVFDIDRVQKQDFLDAWNRISDMQKARNKKQSRSRATADDKLIYAIFKQRQKTPPTTFKTLYEMYENGSLPGYDESPRRGIYRDYTWLQKHYNRYKPKMPSQTDKEIQQYYFSIHNLPIDDNRFDVIAKDFERKKQATTE